VKPLTVAADGPAPIAPSRTMCQGRARDLVAATLEAALKGGQKPIGRRR